VRLVRRHQQRGQVLPHRLVQHRPLWLPPPVLPPALSHQSLPSHTSPGLTLLLGSYGLSWSPWLLGGGRGATQTARQEGRARYQTGTKISEVFVRSCHVLTGCLEPRSVAGWRRE